VLDASHPMDLPFAGPGLQPPTRATTRSPLFDLSHHRNGARMTDKPQGGLNLFSLEPRIKVLHLTWLAFFVSFLVWFNHAPLMAAIRASLNLTDQEVSALLILNVALTIPARIVIGMLVDKLGPRLVYSLLLVISGALCVFFALARTSPRSRSPASCWHSSAPASSSASA
jgi:Na+/melibiose symporter-like transporter